MRTERYELARPFFMAWALLSLVTALLWALLPGGLPSSSSFGSAFSPSTTIVSLKTPDSTRFALKRVAEADDDTSPDSSEASGAAIIFSPLALAFREAVPALSSRSTQPTAPASSPLRAFHARAPPTA